MADQSMMPRRIRAVDVELHQLDIEHIDALIAAIATSLPSLGPWFPWAQAVPRREEQIERAVAADEAFSAGRDFEYSLFEVGTHELVGGLRLNALAGPSTAEIGYWIRSDRQRRGFATQATRVATAAAFSHLPHIDLVEIHMDLANKASARVAAAAGFSLERQISRAITAPGHTGCALIWARRRPHGEHVT